MTEVRTSPRMRSASSATRAISVSAVMDIDVMGASSFVPGLYPAPPNPTPPPTHNPDSPHTHPRTRSAAQSSVPASSPQPQHRLRPQDLGPRTPDPKCGDGQKPKLLTITCGVRNAGEL